MFDEILRDVERLSEEWARRPPSPVELAMADPERAPRPAEGADSSGTVRVAIDADGLPESITVAPGWRRGVGSERFSDAVLEAYESAATIRLTGRVPEPVDHREMMTADLPPGIATGTGTAALGKVVLTLSEVGLRSFTAEPGWLARQQDHDLAEAIATALASARSDLTSVRERMGDDPR